MPHSLFQPRPGQFYFDFFQETSAKKILVEMKFIIVIAIAVSATADGKFSYFIYNTVLES